MISSDPGQFGEIFAPASFSSEPESVKQKDGSGAARRGRRRRSRCGMPILSHIEEDVCPEQTNRDVACPQTQTNDLIIFVCNFTDMTFAGVQQAMKTILFTAYT